MKKIAALAVVFLLPFAGAAANSQANSQANSEANSQASSPAREFKAYDLPRTEVVPIRDSKSGGQYELYIKLPEGYSENTDLKYPVIYTTDAKWHMDLLSGASEYLMPNTILVGVSWQLGLNDEREHVSRFRDYTVMKIENAPVPTGEASSHLAFMRGDVIKYVEKNYRTKPDERAYLGYSLGGAFGAYILFAEPDTFNHYILGSPAFDERDIAFITELAAKMTEQKQNVSANVFVSIGELETTEMDITKTFAAMLEQRSRRLSFAGLQIIEGSDHGTAVPETFVRSVKWLSQQTAE